MTDKELIALAAKAAADPFSTAMDEWKAQSSAVTAATASEAYRLIGWEWGVAQPGALVEARMIRTAALKLIHEAAGRNEDD